MDRGQQSAAACSAHSLGAAHAMSTREGQKVLRDSFSGTTGLRLGGTKAVRWSRISFVLSALYCRVATVLYTYVQNSRDSGVQHHFSTDAAATPQHKSFVHRSCCTVRSPSPASPPGAGITLLHTLLRPLRCKRQVSNKGCNQLYASAALPCFVVCDDPKYVMARSLHGRNSQ